MRPLDFLLTRNFLQGIPVLVLMVARQSRGDGGDDQGGRESNLGVWIIVHFLPGLGLKSSSAA
jgi:hypothetical protein